MRRCSYEAVNDTDFAFKFVTIQHTTEPLALQP